MKNGSLIMDNSIGMIKPESVKQAPVRFTVILSSIYSYSFPHLQQKDHIFLLFWSESLPGINEVAAGWR